MTIDPTAWAMTKGSGFASLMRLQPQIESNGLDFRAVLAVAQEQHQGLHNGGTNYSPNIVTEASTQTVRNERPAEISGGMTA